MSCNGFNSFGGAFSFINGENVKKALKQQFKEGAAFAMVLAVDSLSPVVANSGKFISNILSKMHVLNVKRCDDLLAAIPDIDTLKRKTARLFNVQESQDDNKTDGLSKAVNDEDEKQSANKDKETKLKGELGETEDTLAWLLGERDDPEDKKHPGFFARLKDFFSQGDLSKDTEDPDGPDALAAWFNKWRKYFIDEESAKSFLQEVCGFVSGDGQKTDSQFTGEAKGKDFFVKYIDVDAKGKEEDKGKEDDAKQMRFFKDPLTSYAISHLEKISGKIKTEGGQIGSGALDDSEEFFLAVSERYPYFNIYNIA